MGIRAVRCHLPVLSVVLVAGFPPAGLGLAGPDPGPYERQVTEQVQRLRSDDEGVRAGAAEALGFLRAREAEGALVGRLGDASVLVRREAAMALGWCGGRRSVRALLDSLDDSDWVTRQAAQVSLTNLTGMEFPLDARAAPESREAQAARWRSWWATVAPDRPPEAVLELLKDAEALNNRRVVTASSTYKGPPGVLCDGLIGPAFWQTKNVPPPQWCRIDLGEPENVSRVVVHQYGPDFVMTGYRVETSLDGGLFRLVDAGSGVTPVKLVVDFEPCRARYVRVTSTGSRRPTYPTTFFEVEVGTPGTVGIDIVDAELRTRLWRHERGFRALGALGGRGATEAILRCLGSSPPAAEPFRPALRAAIRALGRLGDEAGVQALVRLLDSTEWARHAAEALADTGDPTVVPALLEAYGRYSKHLDGRNPTEVPADDRMTFPSEDRMLETPYWIAFALCRLPLDGPVDLAALRKLAPRILANLPGDHDTFMLYEPETGHLLTRHLLECAGLRQEACEQAFELLGQPRRVPIAGVGSRWPEFGPERASSWLPAVCTEVADLPRLIALLSHRNGWVRLNAAKTLTWLGAREAVDPLARMLREAPAEADYGTSGTFKDEEYNDPAPRWREGLIRALGALGARDHVGLLVGILQDETSVLEVRHAAARALGDLGGREALAALTRAAREHPFHSIRHVARDALRAHGADLDSGRTVPSLDRQRVSVEESASGSVTGLLDALVFIQGSNNIPNTIGTVEQADRWRQTYVVTDSGPAYRPGRNLRILRPVRPDGRVLPLTAFRDGYVAEPEVCWDGKHVLFTRRGEDDPWWHIYRIRTDGSELERLTDGPYHHVGPACLPDGRIVLASSRGGIRDEYHGYPCTALYVMNSDGSDLHPIATNIGRDNEPAMLHDGRIVFSRLEVFYSRNKTELTLHAAHPDGTFDMVLYGPERRGFWRRLDHGPPTPADGQENPLTHRVLRMTQPQPMPDGRSVVVVTQGGLAVVGMRSGLERILTPENRKRSYTTPFPLPDGRLLCASTLKTPDREKVNLGLYVFDPDSGRLDLIYDDAHLADFEPRPLSARVPPPVLATRAERDAYSGRFLCTTVRRTREPEVAERGRLVRLIEGVPVVARHSTQTNEHPVWKNHGGTLARVLGTTPLAADGSFHVEAPADRLLHFQVLDSDRRVVGNQLTWIYTRPGETRSCVGCHERPDTTPDSGVPQAAPDPVRFLPGGDHLRYRAKAWFKGHLPAAIERRTRTVRAVNLLAR